MKSSDIYSNNWILRWLLNNKFPLLRISVLFLSLFTLTYVFNSIDNSLYLNSGKSSLIIPFEDGKANDIIRIADDILFINILIENNKKINVTGKLVNENKKGVQSYFGFNEIITRKSLDTLVSEKSIVVLARKVNFQFLVVQNYIKIQTYISGIGYLEDIGNYLLFISFMVIVYLLKKLSEKFVFVFTGIDANNPTENFNYNNGLLKVVKFDDTTSKEEYENSFRQTFEIISLKNKKAKKVYVLAYTAAILLAVILTLYPYYFAKTSNVNWNYSPQIFPLGSLSNLIKDLFIFTLLVPPILFRVILVSYYTIKYSKFFNDQRMFVIYPLSPDRAGGLAPLGEVTLILFYMSISFSLISLLPV